MRITSILLVSLAAAASMTAQTGSVIPDSQIPRDQVQRDWVNFETHPIQPIALSNDQSLLMCINQPAGRLVIFNAADRSVSGVVRTGPGVVSVVPRPGTNEVFLVDAVAGAVSVLDLGLRSIVKTIRVGAQPHGLVFTPSGDRAYVACSAIDRVDVIDLRTGSGTAYGVVNQIAIPAKNPRAIAYLGGKVWVASLLSGNNTSVVSPGANPGATSVKKVTAQNGGSGFQSPLPDRDILAITPHPTNPALDVLDPTATVTAVGTSLFNLHDAAGALWVPNTDALNADVIGEKNFVGGQVVRNQLTKVTIPGGATTVYSLDLPPAGSAPCAQPTGMAYDPVNGSLFVCGYGSDTVAVLNASTGTWRGQVALPAAPGFRTGPRCALYDSTRKLVYVLNKAADTLSVIDAAATPTLLTTVSLGLDPTPAPIKRGRGHLINANHSLSGTGSCASCHVDGHLDGLGWDLSAFLDPVGTQTPMYEQDRKGPMVTQSLRGLRETLPYHWRGERATLESFNPAFVGLLKRPQELTSAEFADFRAYIESLTYSPNPRQSSDRTYTTTQRMGAAIYMSTPVVSNLACNGCHALPLGTQGEPLFDVPGNELSRSFVVPHLRGVVDKLSPAFFVGGNFQYRPETGFGLLHSGFFATLEVLTPLQANGDFMSLFIPLSQTERTLVGGFVSALDTGLAPATAFQATVNQQNAGSFSTDLTYLTSQADLGNCDIAAFANFRISPTQSVKRGYAYDRTSHQFWSTTISEGLNQPALLVGLASLGMGEVTFVGLPVGMGWRFGVDEDMDWLQDDDEAARGCNGDVSDKDLDGFPDGWEVARGMNPTQFDSSANDTQAPVIFGAQLVYQTTNVAKYRVDTSEPTRLLVTTTVNNVTTSTVVSPADPGPDFQMSHMVVVQGLSAGQAATISIQATDPAGNSSASSVSLVAQSQNFPSLHVGSLTVQVTTDPASQTATATIQVGVASETGALLANMNVEARIYLEVGGVLTEPFATPSNHMVTAANGIATFTGTFTLPPPNNRKLHVAVWDVSEPVFPPVRAYVEARDVLNYANAGF